MSHGHYCEECGCNKFMVNGWTVNEAMVEGEHPHQPGDYNERDEGKVDVVEIVCNNCGEAQRTV